MYAINKIRSLCLISYAYIKLLKYKSFTFIYLNKPKDIFSYIYYHNSWGGKKSVSGLGSDLIQTLVIRKEIPIVLKELNVKSLLDAPCGDFHWMKETDLDIKKYIGIDIVPELIAQNQQKYGSEIREFIALNIINDDLPQADMILCRDCLVHLSFKDIFSAIRNFKKSKSTYILTTTYTGCLNNRDIITGWWRPLNLQLPPFNFPKPIKLINEKSTEKYDKFYDKKIALWKLEDI